MYFLFLFTLIIVNNFQIQLEISLPDAHGRHQIFMIHTARMREHKILSTDVDLQVSYFTV